MTQIVRVQVKRSFCCFIWTMVYTMVRFYQCLYWGNMSDRSLAERITRFIQIIEPFEFMLYTGGFDKAVVATETALRNGGTKDVLQWLGGVPKILGYDQEAAALAIEVMNAEMNRYT